MRPSLPVLALIACGFLGASPPSDHSTPPIPRLGRALALAPGPVRLGALAVSRNGGFAVAYDKNETLIVAAFGADDEREFRRSLGSLGYSGPNNINGLVALPGRTWAVSSDYDHHYAGWQGSDVVLVSAAGRRVVQSSGRFFGPVLVGDGDAGLAWFAADTETGATVFRRFAQGALTPVRRRRVGGLPFRAFALRDGFVVASRMPDGLWRATQLDPTGHVTKTANLAGKLVSDGESRVADLSISADTVTVRFASSDLQWGPSHVVARARDGFLGTAELVGSPGGPWLLAWQECPQRFSNCHLVTRFVDPLTGAVGPASAPFGRDAGSLEVAAEAGHFVVAWNEGPYPGGPLWARRVH